MDKKINSLKNRIESYKTSSNVFKSFKYAFSGISYVLKTSRNFKIQLIFAITSLMIGFLLQILSLIHISEPTRQIQNF